MIQLFQVLYCSRNLIQGDADLVRGHIRSILEASRRNNAHDGITGGLLFSAGLFAQVLEGPPDAVERTFERIQCDPRHADVAVLEAKPIAARDFPSWSMAFDGAAEADPLTGIALDRAFKGRSDAGENLLKIMRSLTRDEHGMARRSHQMPAET